jgi:hypothetical protein
MFRRSSRSLALVLVTLLTAAAAQAGTISVVLTSFTGDPIEARVTLDDRLRDGSLIGSVQVLSPYQGDLRALFLDIADDSLIPGLIVTGADVTDVVLGNVIDVGQGGNLNGGGTPCPCDIGIEFGTPGTGKDDIAFTTFNLSHESQFLSLDLFEGELMGLRITSVGDGEGYRGGSAKLSGVPEPTTALLLFSGIAGLGWAGRRRHGAR